MDYVRNMKTSMITNNGEMILQQRKYGSEE
jgi:hypothetical protein